MWKVHHLMGTRSRQWSAPTRPSPSTLTIITQRSWCGQVTISLLSTLLLSSNSCSVLTSYFYHEFVAFILAKSYRNISCGSENGLWTLKESFTNCIKFYTQQCANIVFLTYPFSILFVCLSLTEKRVDQSLTNLQNVQVYFLPRFLFNMTAICSKIVL